MKSVLSVILGVALGVQAFGSSSEEWVEKVKNADSCTEAANMAMESLTEVMSSKVFGTAVERCESEFKYKFTEGDNNAYYRLIGHCQEKYPVRNNNDSIMIMSRFSCYLTVAEMFSKIYAEPSVRR